MDEMDQDKNLQIIMKALEDNLKRIVFPVNAKPTLISIVINYPESRASLVIDLKGKV